MTKKSFFAFRKNKSKIEKIIEILAFCNLFINAINFNYLIMLLVNG